MSAGRERLFELLALRAVEGLESSEGAEVNSLLEKYPLAQEDGFERAAAAVHLALVGPEQPMPQGLAQRILTGWETSHRAEEVEDQAAPVSSSTGSSIAWWSTLR